MRLSARVIAFVVVAICGCYRGADDDSSGTSCSIEAPDCPDDEVCAMTSDEEMPGARCGEECDQDLDCAQTDFMCCNGACLHINDCFGE